MAPTVEGNRAPRSELRLGLVLYGGVSLAVYMNGVVQELLHLVRASQKRDRQNSYGPLLDAAAMDVVIDVIAGTSAGGLNGLVLAKALATGSDAIQGMSQLWKTEAQIDKLVETDDPHAMLSGEIMDLNLHRILAAMSAT
ncbi:MAG TPA: patatin-like phospholipase family protein, partial [Symbiobacteriaceae bacterium]|nr:patatin-like phospholipase family protein [Symbiobacteriaceae bacterium]